MAEINSDEKQECFIEECFEQIQSKYLRGHFNVDVVVNVHKQLPANQLRNIGRPQKLAPRTFSINKLMSLLPNPLNQSCIQTCQKSKTANSKFKIANKQRMTIQEYFTKNAFKQVYDKLSQFPTDSKSFTGKIMSVDSVADYNHKLFRQLQQQVKDLKQQQQDSIDSNFESGNLCRAYISNTEQNEYFAMIQNDINTYGYNIWFFFRFRNRSKGLKTFHLLNMIKKTDNYKKGMQISIFSMKKFKNQRKMWHKGGDKINFGQTNFPRMFHLTEKYYCLSFQYEFEQQNDEVYFAMNQPYTYTRMINHLNLLQQKRLSNKIKIEIKPIGHTLADNVIPGIRLWTQQYENKQTILITARQHPCETVSSFVCQGMINDLMKQQPWAMSLLQKYQIFIIPMMNPDGVIHGSSRCNLSGFDLNRQWSQFLIKQFTPETHRIKKYLSQLHKQNRIKYCFDLHGHGKKLNSFLFSCKRGDGPSNRMIELCLNKFEPRFSILDCTYGIDRDKQNTIRSKLYQIGITNCYTLENSLMGYVDSNGKIKQYTQEDLNHIGQSVLKGIFVQDNTSQKVKSILGFSKQQLIESSTIVIEKIVQRQKDDKRINEDNNASDSDPDGDCLDLNQRLQTCCKNNMNLKKKITQNIKKEKVKKKKMQQLKASLKKEQRKNSSNSENDSGQIALTPGNLENQSQKKGARQNQLSLSQQKKNMNKLSLSNKRTIYSKKMKEKRQTLKQTKLTENQFIIKNQLKRSDRQALNRTEVKFKNIRLKSQLNEDQKSRKASCSVIYQYPHEGMINMKRKMSYRVKTESIHTHSQKQIPGVYYQGSQKKQGIKFSQLKQQSLKALLTDTFSVLKIKPKLSIKRYVKVNPYEQQKKMQQQLIPKQQKIEHLSLQKKYKAESQKRVKTYSSGQMSNLSQRIQTQGGQLQFRKTQFGYQSRKRNFKDFKYKRFQSFLYNGITTDKNQKQNGSVFYYFPVL